MHPTRPVVFGLACCLASVIGCVSIRSVAGGVKSAVEAQGDILSGIDSIDQACQDFARSDEQLGRCRAGRDKARAGIGRQLIALQELAGGPAPVVMDGGAK